MILVHHGIGGLICVKVCITGIVNKLTVDDKCMHAVLDLPIHTFSIMVSIDTFGMWHYRLGTRNKVDTQPDIRLKLKSPKISFHDI